MNNFRLMKYFKRNIEKKVLKNLNEPEALFILGARQVGKTSLMKRIINTLDNDNFVYIDLENLANLSIFDKGINEFLAFLKYQNLNETKRAYIFIDEIQYAKDFSGLIKYFVDHYSDKYKLVLSGSSSLQIRNSFKESLVGRKKIFELYPLTFSEFCLFKGEDKLSEILSDIDAFELWEDPLRFEKEKVKNLLKEFLVFGGFPKVVLQKEKTAKIEILQDIVQSYIMKDIRYIFHLEKVSQFNHLIKLLAAFSGKELNNSQLANETHLHKQTLEHYLTALESSYIINQVRPFYRNFSSELRKTPKCFFLDNSVEKVVFILRYLLCFFLLAALKTDGR